jgi:multiple sugar transport system substrate-binding protein
VLRFATWNTDPESIAINQAIATKFEEANPGVKVQIELYGDGFDDKLTAAMGAGDAPDLMYMWNFPAYKDALMPLDDMIARDAAELNLDDIPAGLMNISKIDGKTYAMPIGFTTQVVFYNKDMFAAAGVPEPAAGWTWADLRADCRQVPQCRDQDLRLCRRCQARSRSISNSSSGRTAPNTSRTTARLLDGYMNSPEAAEVLDMFADMIKTEEAVALNIGDDTPGSALFKAGKIAMFQSAMWSKTGIDESGINYGVAPLPAFGDKPVHSVIGASGISISKDTKNPIWPGLSSSSSRPPKRSRCARTTCRSAPRWPKSWGWRPTRSTKPFFDMLAVSNRETNAFLKNPNWGQIQANLALAIEATMVDQGNAKAHLDEAVAASARFLN